MGRPDRWRTNARVAFKTHSARYLACEMATLHSRFLHTYETYSYFSYKPLVKYQLFFHVQLHQHSSLLNCWVNKNCKINGTKYQRNIFEIL
jgi:hypothetical protein